METIQPRISPSNVRVHHAAALIAFYVRQANRKKIIHFIPPLVDGGMCNNYWHWVDPQNKSISFGVFLRACLRMWPSDNLEYFNAFPFVRLLQRHTQLEQLQICTLLEKYHGFTFEF